MRRKYLTKSQYTLSPNPWLGPRSYAIVMSARKLHHYFKAYRVRVIINQPLNDIFGNRDSSDRIRKWAMELSKHVIDIEKRSAIKSQVLDDFIAD
jgi:uncharacterized membrane protein